jgi:chromosome segregation ATPase
MSSVTESRDSFGEKAGTLAGDLATARQDTECAVRELREEELRSLRAQLNAETQANRLAQEKIAQLQQEMASYRQLVENPAALRETEDMLARRVGELAVAQEQVRILTEELRIAHEANLQQDERVAKLRSFTVQLKQKCDALAESAKEPERLRAQLREEAARRRAAEAEVERLQQNPPPKPQEAAGEEMDAKTLTDLRNEIHAAMRAAAPHRFGAAPAQPFNITNGRKPGIPSRK